MLSDTNIKRLYKKQKPDSVLNKVGIKVIVITLLLGYYIFSDIFIREMVAWAYPRILPFSLSIVFLFIYYTKVIKNKKTLVYFFYTLLSSLILMILALNTLSYQTEYFSSSMYGIIMLILIVFMAAKSGYKTLLPIYFIPILLFIIYHIFIETNISGKEVADFGNAMVILIASLVISEIQEKMRFKEFRLKTELKNQNEEIEAQKDEIESQRDKLAEQQEKLTDSIDYAKYLQNSVQPTVEEVNNLIPENFLLYLPKDTVSGDFYWVNKIENKLVIIVADCTGHGVPGAIMSMLGVTLLNEIILQERILSPAEILGELRKGVKSTLKQNYSTNGIFDGMDMGVCVYDKDNKTMVFSGAYHSLTYIKNKELINIKGDKQPVAIHSIEKDFTEHIINIEGNETFYLQTDGYIDQIGIKKNKKFLRKNLNKLLLEISDKSLDNQKEILYKKHIDWKGKLEQIDDILLLGFKL